MVNLESCSNEDHCTLFIDEDTLRKNDLTQIMWPLKWQNWD